MGILLKLPLLGAISVGWPFIENESYDQTAATNSVMGFAGATSIIIGIYKIQKKRIK